MAVKGAQGHWRPMWWSNLFPVKDRLDLILWYTRGEEALTHLGAHLLFGFFLFLLFLSGLFGLF